MVAARHHVVTRHVARTFAPVASVVTAPVASDDSRNSFIVLQEVRHALVPALRMQYMQVAGQPGASGKMVVHWTVVGGRATGVTVGENTVASPELQRRVVTLVQRWRYPVVPSSVSVSFPFVFG